MSVIKEVSDLQPEGVADSSRRTLGTRLSRRTDLPEPPVTTDTFDDPGFRELSVDFDREERVLFYYMEPIGRPCATVGLMREIGRLQETVRDLFRCHDDAGDPPVRYMVLASKADGIFGLGGDLGLFAKLIRDGNRRALHDYARLSIDVIYANAANLHLPLVSISLVRGDALGGGFEAALSSDVIIAERSAKFGLPEILFNLFPGMGAYTFLARRVSPAVAERMILSGTIYSADELHDMGIVDVVAPDGEGEAALYDYVRKNRRRFTAHQAIYRARQCVNPVSYREMADIADLWVDAALKIEENDIKRMLRLAAAQDRRIARTQDDVPPAEVRQDAV